MKPFCYLNGNIVSFDRAGVGLSDLGLLRGYGVFDFSRTYNGQPFLFDRHLNRLRKSAQVLNLELSLSDDRIYQIVKKLINQNQVEEAGIRIVLTGGEQSNFFILVKELTTPDWRNYKDGVKVVTYKHKRILPQVKSLVYPMAYKLKHWQKEQNASEILYINKGKVTEATKSNFFVFKGDKLVTPKQNILKGVTRNLVLELADGEFVIQERDLLREELSQATEAFLTSTTKQVLPVVQINDQRVGSGEVGNNTQKLMAMFEKYVKDFVG